MLISRMNVMAVVLLSQSAIFSWVNIIKGRMYQTKA